MKLEQLLEEIKIGEDNYRQIQTSKELIESFDEDINNYKISKLISALNSKFAENLSEDTSPAVRAFRKIENKIKMMEDRIEDKGFVSEAYARMKYDSISEDFAYLSENINKNKIQRQLDTDSLAHAVALVIYEAKKLSQEGNFDFREKDFPVMNESFKVVVNKELKLIEESLV